MKKYICDNCGAQYNQSPEYPKECIICSDERQYVPSSGQKWTTLEELLEGSYKNRIDEVEPNLYRIKTLPQVGIGQNAYLIVTETGNFLWDCITYLDDETVKAVNEIGGLHGIIISHPHYYSTIVEWAEAFACPIYIHEKDSEWITRNSDNYVFWNGGTLELSKEVQVIHIGGHFEGSSVLLWEKGSEGKGSLLVGDSIFIVPDQGWVSFLYSHPNRIPLPSFEVKNIVDSLQAHEFESIYGAFDNVIKRNGKESILKSANRYIYHVERNSR